MLKFDSAWKKLWFYCRSVLRGTRFSYEPRHHWPTKHAVLTGDTEGAEYPTGCVSNRKKKKKKRVPPDFLFHVSAVRISKQKWSTKWCTSNSFETHMTLFYFLFFWLWRSSNSKLLDKAISFKSSFTSIAVWKISTTVTTVCVMYLLQAVEVLRVSVPPQKGGGGETFLKGKLELHNLIVLCICRP